MAMNFKASVVNAALECGSREAYTPTGLRREYSFTHAELMDFANHVRKLVHEYDQGEGVFMEIERLHAENIHLRQHVLTPETFARVAEWLRSGPDRRAGEAFAGGIEKEIATMLENIVVPVMHARQHGQETAEVVGR